jgi:hypothetical protein
MNQAIDQITESQLFAGMKTVNYLFEMRDIIQNNITTIDVLLENLQRDINDNPFSTDLIRTKERFMGRKDAWLEALRLLNATDFDRNPEKVSQRIKLKVHGTDLPICPKCENGNAMFDKRELPERKWFECRDCGYIVEAENAELIFLELDEKGMGVLSTYHEIKRLNGEDWI